MELNTTAEHPDRLQRSDRLPYYYYH